MDHGFFHTKKTMWNTFFVFLARFLVINLQKIFHWIFNLMDSFFRGIWNQDRKEKILDCVRPLRSGYKKSSGMMRLRIWKWEVPSRVAPKVRIILNQLASMHGYWPLTKSNCCSLRKIFRPLQTVYWRTSSAL